jgi:hypothetical protein
MLMTDRGAQLDELLGLSIAEFDIPDDVYARAVARYEHAAAALAEHWPEGAGEIYPQGSIRLGTVTAPVNHAGEYDFDLVCRRELVPQSTTKQELKLDVGTGLAGYVATGPQGRPRLSEGKRCWTLDYPREPFHMDVLPAIPDPDATGTAILLTDRELREWQHSDPIAFADWFHARMRTELVQLSEAVAKRMDIEQAPPSALKTTLQRTVQALKRHRDIHFASAPKDGPASVIITTLAARAYRGGGSLLEVLLDVSARMPGLVEHQNGLWLIPNPVAPEENFADRWNRHPERARRFFDWMERARADFAGLGSDLGLDTVLEKMAESFGEIPARRAGKRFGGEIVSVRGKGALGVAATGLLGPRSTRPVPSHTFHGDAPSSRRP